MQTTRRQFHFRALGLAAASLGIPAIGRAQAAAYPSRPIRLIVPYAAGGGPDVMTRKMALTLADTLGKATVVVENIVGAGGILAAQEVARMAPDGYNLITGASTHVVQKAMQPSVKFDPLKDFTHITLTSFSPQMLVVSAASPFRTIDDLVAAIRKEPGKFNYASGGVGSGAHLCGASFAVEAKLDVVHVPYKGSVEIVPSLLSGATHFAFPVASTAIPQVQSGKVRALAVTSAKRMPAFPNVPTLVETFKTDDLALDAWGGVWGPAGMAPEVVDVLFKAFTRVYNTPSVRADADAAGAVIQLSQSPAEFRRFMEVETRKFAKIVKDANLTTTG
ncbi:MAG: tripartite tricarboxylate transporter substrate binding protein [Rhodoferax sp.]